MLIHTLSPISQKTCQALFVPFCSAQRTSYLLGIPFLVENIRSLFVFFLRNEYCTHRVHRPCIEVFVPPSLRGSNIQPAGLSCPHSLLTSPIRNLQSKINNPQYSRPIFPPVHLSSFPILTPRCKMNLSGLRIISMNRAARLLKSLEPIRKFRRITHFECVRSRSIPEGYEAAHTQNALLQ
jgi:hypothetical protein